MSSAQSGFNPRLMEEAREGANKMANMATKTNVVRIGDANTNAGFPAQLSTTDPEDQKFALRKRILGNEVNVPGVGTAIVGEDFWQYAKRKMDDQEEAAFKAWVMQNADLSNPADAQWWFQRVPWLRTAREEFIDYTANLQRQAAHIALRGPQSEDDLRFMFLQKNGEINVPNVALQNLASAQYELPETYKKGFFSPFAQKLLSAGPADFPPVKNLPQASAGFNWSAPLAPAGARAKAGVPNIFSTNANPLAP